MNLIRCFILFLSSYCVYGRAIIENNDGEVEGYYWRDYTGIVPKDALPGGKNANGKTTYIGQILYREQLIPAKIDPELHKVSFEWGYREHEALTNIKILCTQHPEQFEWLESGNGVFGKVKDQNLIPGGHEAGAMLFVGRKELDGALEVGKIISTNIQTTLNTVKDGKGLQHGSFSVLSYNPNIEMKRKNNACSSNRVPPNDMDIDVRSGGQPSSTVTAKCKDMQIFVNVFNS